MYGRRPCNDIQNTNEILTDLIVPEAEDTEALGLQISRTSQIMLAPSSMLTTIDLNDQPTLEADEIDDVTADRDLSAEFQTVASPVA